MIIKYENITLRAIEENDLELLKDMINDPEIENMMTGFSFPVSTSEHKKWFNMLSNEHNKLRLIIDTEEYGTIGMIMLSNIDWKNRNAEFHIKITGKNNLRGKGYGTKATKALIKYAFEQLNIHCIYSNIIEYNIASQILHEKCGFKKEGILRDRVYKNGKYNNIVVWSINNKDINKNDEI